MSRSDQLRQLVAQLDSLASMEDVVAHGFQSLLDSLAGIVAPVSVDERALPAALLRPRSRSRYPLPKAAPNRPHGSILLSQRGPTGLAVKSCLPTPLERSVSSHRRSGSPTSAAGLVEPASATGASRAATLSALRAAAADPRRRGSSGAAEARRRSRDKRHRRTRGHPKRSMWREILRQVLVWLAMWACCRDTTSDDDEHNTDKSALLFFRPRPCCASAAVWLVGD